MITREQVADLQPGDVVEMRHDEWPEGTCVRGPLRELDGGDLFVGPTPVRYRGGEVAGFIMAHSPWSLTVVSRAPRPLYVNHPRTKPVMGDVVSRGDTDGAAWSYCPRPMRGMGNRWRNTANDEWFADEDFIDWGNGLRLLVDGETGQVVP